jgi:transcriptional regulator with XRE-family HTH domain
MKDRLRQFRESRGLSQKDMAEKLGLAATTYSNYENGKAEPSVETYQKLAAIKCDLHWLLTGIKAAQADYETSMKYLGALEERRMAFGELAHEVGEALRQCAGMKPIRTTGGA